MALEDPSQESEELKEDETTLMRLRMELIDMVSSRSLPAPVAATKEKYEVGRAATGILVSSDPTARPNASKRISK